MRKKLKLLFRTSGGKAESKELGLGHIYRSINLAKNLPLCNRFFLIEDYGGAESIFRLNNFSKIHKLKPNISWKEDFLQTLSIMNKFHIDILIVDKYKTKKAYLNKLKQYVKIVYISDLESYNFPADLVVNGFIGFKNKITVNSFGSKTLLGPKFQILDPKFTRKKSSPKKYDLLVTFGGFDEKGLNEVFLKTISTYVKLLRIKFIIGPSSNNSKYIQTFKKKFNKNITIIQKTNNMANEINASKFGLCSGGLTTYEFALLKVPFAIICNEFHQLKTARQWKNKNIAENLGLISKSTSSRLETWIKKIITNKPKIAISFCLDGKGGQRVAIEILKIKY